MQSNTQINKEKSSIDVLKEVKLTSTYIDKTTHYCTGVLHFFARKSALRSHWYSLQKLEICAARPDKQKGEGQPQALC